MYPRINYEMAEEDLKKILEACKPVVVMTMGGYSPPSPQENANNAWKELGEKMGFDHMSVQPISGKGTRFFSAIPNETKAQKKDREKLEAEEWRLAEIERLKSEIYDRKNALAELGGIK